MGTLLSELEKLKCSDEYPMHMPGHKRRNAMDDIYGLDITEIIGFDNLYDAHGILREAMDYANSLYAGDTKDTEDSKAGLHTYYLVNGSTAGIQIAILAAADMYREHAAEKNTAIDTGLNRLLMASNCHRSVHAAADISGLNKDILDIPRMSGSGIDIGVPPKEVEDRLIKAKDEGRPYVAVVITSPSYEGIISDIEVIADICHRYDTILIVDEAHGAHLDLSREYPNGAIRYGADIVIHSTHKTLAAMTQTALLHAQGGLVDITKIEKYWAWLQTSSPSYILMASIDSSLHHITEHPLLVKEHLKRLSLMKDRLTGLKRLHLLSETDLSPYDTCVALDPCKLIVTTADSSIDGYDLQKILLNDYHIQIEMASLDHIVAITTYMDTEEGLDRFEKAISEIDDKIVDGYYNDNMHVESTMLKTVHEQGLNKESYKRRELYAPCIPDI